MVTILNQEQTILGDAMQGKDQGHVYLKCIRWKMLIFNGILSQLLFGKLTRLDFNASRIYWKTGRSHKK